MEPDHISVAEYRKLNAQSVTARINPRKKTKQSYNECPTEYAECVDLVYQLNQWKDEGKILEFTHISNETFTKSWNVKRKNKAQGVKPGVPDYLILIPPEKDNPQALDSYEIMPGKIVFIEMKRVKGGTVSPEQKQWIEAIKQAGGYARVARGASEAIAFIEGLL